MLRLGISMGFWKTTGKLAWGATKVAAKVTAVTAKAAYNGTEVVAKSIYDHREGIGAAAKKSGMVAAKATATAAKAAYFVAATTAKTVYDNREVIVGTTVGVANGTAKAARDLSGHLVTNDSIALQLRTIESQGQRYRDLTSQFRGRTRQTRLSKPTLLDSLVVGGQTLASYIQQGTVPVEIQQAYELAYPHLAVAHSFTEEVSRLDGDQLVGLVSGVKGKLFELKYVDYLNGGHLPDGFHAELAASPTNPGWDIAILGPDGSMRDTIQAKATDSVSYVLEAIKQNPQIDVVTTSEVHSHLVMQGFADHVIDSGVSDHAITAAVEDGVDGAVVSMHWTPSVVSLALIAFSTYNQEGLSAYQKSRQFGERSLKSYLAYLAGGSLAVLSNTWWIGVIGGVGSRLILGTGRAKRERITQLRELASSNEVVLQRLSRQFK